MKKTVNHLMKDNENYKNKQEIIDAIKKYRDSKLNSDKEETTEVFFKDTISFQIHLIVKNKFK